MSHPIHSVSAPDAQKVQNLPVQTANSSEALPEVEKVMSEVGHAAGSGIGYFFKSLIRGMGSSLGRQIGRSIFGGLFGNSSRRRY